MRSFASLAASCLLFTSGCLFPEYTFDDVTGGASTGTAGAPSGGGGSGGETPGGGGSGGVGGGTGGSGGMAPVEDCFAPGDEDGDSLADCADPDCDVDLECVPAIPVGWGGFGMVALYTGSASTDPACPDGTTTQVHLGSGDLINTSATCSSCSCGSPTWSGCELNDYTAGTAGLQGVRTRNVACANMTATALTDLTIPDPWNGSCTALNTAAGGQTCAGNACNTSIQANTAHPIDGTCLEGGGEPTGGIPTFTNARKACETVDLGGCEGTDRCVARFAAPFEERVCIGKVGDVVCPAGFPDRTVSYGDVSDTRTCSDCSCSTATGGTCKLTVSLFTDAACNTPVGMMTTVESGQCTNLTGNPTIAGRSAAVTQAPSGGGCAVVPGGGVASGAVAPTDPTTFCCLLE